VAPIFAMPRDCKPHFNLPAQLLAKGPANKDRSEGACNGCSSVAGETIEENGADVKSRAGSHYRRPAYRSNQSGKQ
jgi:hypothetical protein